jgi:hydrogenase nickel incorporation protein HypA/HybF
VHELSVTQSVLEIALRHAARAKARRICGLHLVIGELSTIVDDSVGFYWDMISRGTIAQGAELHFRRLPAQLLCLDCDHSYQPPKDALACPQCGGRHVRVVGGDQLQLESIDIES